MKKKHLKIARLAGLLMTVASSYVFGSTAIDPSTELTVSDLVSPLQVTVPPTPVATADAATFLNNVTFKDSARYDTDLTFRLWPEIGVAGSAQPTELQYGRNFAFIAESLNFGPQDTILVIDLRREAHFYLVEQLTGAPIASRPIAISGKAPSTLSSTTALAVSSGQAPTTTSSLPNVNPAIIEALPVQNGQIVNQENNLVAFLGQLPNPTPITIVPNMYESNYATSFPSPLSGEVEWNTKASTNITGLVPTGGHRLLAAHIGCVETEQNMLQRVANLVIYRSAQNPYFMNQGLNVEYLRIPITDMNSPSLSNINAFIQGIYNVEQKNPGSKVALYLHCHGGLGRTAFFMNVAHMLRSTSSLAAINNRQILSGGRDLLNLNLGEVGQTQTAVNNVASALKNVYQTLNPFSTDATPALFTTVASRLPAPVSSLPPAGSNPVVPTLPATYANPLNDTTTQSLLSVQSYLSNLQL